MFPVCTWRCNLWTPTRHCPSSDLNTLFIRLNSVVFSLQSDHINLSGSLSKGRQQPATKTYQKYLPPIPEKLTESSTIVKYLRQFQKVAEQTNLTYANIVEDIGAAAAELKVVWYRPEEFGNVIIHSGDFHIQRKTFRLIQIHMSSVLFVFFLIQLVVLKCSLTMMFWQIQYSFLILRSWVCQSKILVPKTLRTNQVFALLVALTVFSHNNWIVHLVTICYLRLMNHAIHLLFFINNKKLKQSPRKSLIC